MLLPYLKDNAIPFPKIVRCMLRKVSLLESNNEKRVAGDRFLAKGRLPIENSPSDWSTTVQISYLR
jgi:hypothetical protein